MYCLYDSISKSAFIMFFPRRGKAAAISAWRTFLKELEMKSTRECIEEMESKNLCGNRDRGKMMEILQEHGLRRRS